MLDHIDENVLLDLVEGYASPDMTEAVNEHLDVCSDCRGLVARVARASMEHASTVPDTDRGEAPPTGSLLANRFRLRRRLGRGAMGLVYEADDERLNVRVALKLLAPELAAHPAFLKALLNEIVIGRRVTHPNVCRIYDHGTCKQLHFITMELVDGETLEVLLANARLPAPTVVRLLSQICAALEAAHREGVVHRDLKPSNVMVDSAGHVQVMDFGLAQDLGADPSVRFGPVGSPGYWSPEQSRGQRTTAVSDVYSLGVIAFRLFTGRRAEERAEAGALDAIPGPYQPIVARCLEARPEKRFPSAQAVQDALARADDSSAKRRKLRWTGAAGAAVVAAAALTVIRLYQVAHFTASTPPSASTDTSAARSSEATTATATSAASAPAAADTSRPASADKQASASPAAPDPAASARNDSAQARPASRKSAPVAGGKPARPPDLLDGEFKPSRGASTALPKDSAAGDSGRRIPVFE